MNQEPQLSVEYSEHQKAAFTPCVTLKEYNEKMEEWLKSKPLSRQEKRQMKRLIEKRTAQLRKNSSFNMIKEDVDARGLRVIEPAPRQQRDSIPSLPEEKDAEVLEKEECPPELMEKIMERIKELSMNDPSFREWVAASTGEKEAN
jgi:hypothetical protein